MKKHDVNKLLTQYLREMSAEETEVAEKDGQDVLITKMEALARTIWKYALGYVMTSTKDNGKTIMRTYKPDRTMIAMIYDRLEGRVPMVSPPKRGSLPDKITEEGKRAIASIGKPDGTV